MSQDSNPNIGLTSFVSRRGVMNQIAKIAAGDAIGTALAPIAHAELRPPAVAFPASQTKDGELLALGKQLDQVMNSLIAATRNPLADDVADAVFNSLNERLCMLVRPILAHTATSSAGLAVSSPRGNVGLRGIVGMRGSNRRLRP
jgi:hypothetical protein